MNADAKTMSIVSTVKAVPHRLWKIRGEQEIIYFSNNLFPIYNLYLLKLKMLPLFCPFPAGCLSSLFDRYSTLEALSSDEYY